MKMVHGPVPGNFTQPPAWSVLPGRVNIINYVYRLQLGPLVLMVRGIAH